MRLFKKKTVTKTYDKENKKPVIKASICNGEQVAGCCILLIMSALSAWLLR